MYATAVVIMNDRDEASDLVQEAFARLWERREAIPDPEAPEGYCVTVIRRICIDRLRRTSRIQQVPVESLADISAADTSRRSESADTLRHISRLMHELPQNQQEVLKMSAIAGMDNAEIAQATGLSNVNVRTLLSRGRRQLKKLFETEKL